MFIVSICVPFLSIKIPGHSKNYNLAFGSNAYIFGGWVGLVSIIISFILFKRFKTRLAIIFGIVGCITIGFNLIFILILINLPLDPHDYVMEIGYFLGIISWILICGITILLSSAKFKQKEEDVSLVKKTILELGTKFDRLEIHEISERCGVDKSTIINVIKEMVNNHEIYAEFFKSSNSVVFNQQANIDEIDKLMGKFKEWEQEKLDKKS